MIVLGIDVTRQEGTRRTISTSERADDRRGTGIAHLGTWEWEPGRDTVTWSDELYRIYALTREEYVPNFKGYLEKIHSEDQRDRVRVTMESVLARPYLFFSRWNAFSGPDRLRPDIFTHGVIRSSMRAVTSQD